MRLNTHLIRNLDRLQGKHDLVVSVKGQNVILQFALFAVPPQALSVRKSEISMTPKFARAVDPVFTYMLDLLERIDNTVELDPLKERTRLMERISAAGALLGHAEEWTELARYAIVAWIDSELTTVRSWEGREWWLHHSLELEYWRQGLANVEFYRRAQGRCPVALEGRSGSVLRLRRPRLPRLLRKRAGSR